jgi:hypothetical protein
MPEPERFFWAVSEATLVLIPSILILQAFYLVFQGLVAFGVLHRCALPYDSLTLGKTGTLEKN